MRTLAFDPGVAEHSSSVGFQIMQQTDRLRLAQRKLKEKENDT